MEALSRAITINPDLPSAHNGLGVAYAQLAGFNPAVGLYSSILPLLAYATLLAAAIAMTWHPAAGLFVLAAAALTLLFNGIHNSWDSVTYIAIQSRERKQEKQ